MSRLHPLVVPERMARSAVRGGAIPLFLIAIGSLLFGDAIPTGVAFAAVPLGVTLGAAYGLAWYLRFEYELTHDTLDITSGVIARRDREIPYQRIQTVDVTRTVLHRVFGLAIVNVETAGGGSTEASLNFVSAAEADRIRRLVRTRREHAVAERGRTPSGATGAGPAATGTDSAATRSTDTVEPSGLTDRGAEEIPAVFFRLSLRELLVYSLLTFRTGAVAAVLFALPLLQGYVPREAYSLVERLGGAASLATLTPSRALVTLAIVGSLVLFGAYVVSAVYGAITYYGFTLGRRGEDLVYECGLFKRYSGSIPLSKVQSLTLTENVPMRRLGYAGLTVETAGYGGNANGGRLSIGSGAPSAIPAARRDVALEVARTVEDVDAFDIERPPKTARRRYAARYALAVTGLLAAFALAARSIPDFDAWYVPAVLFAVVPVAAHLKWVHRGYYADGSHVVLRTGFWLRRSTIVPYERLQTMARRRSVFQRRLGLADFVADTASSVSITGATPTAFDVDAETATRLHERCRERLQARIREQ